MNENLPLPPGLTGSLPPPNSLASRELAELVDRLAERMRSGQPVDLESLALEHPEHAAELARLLPAAEALVWLGISAAAGEGGVAIPGEPGGQPSGLLGDFRLIREIGRGGMGIVYEAEQLSLGRRVALKVLPFAATLDEKAQRRFKNEALAAAHLDHPHIVDVYGVGCERGVHYYAMRLIEGRTLAELIDQLRRDVNEGQPPQPPIDPAAATDTAPVIAAGHSTQATAQTHGRFRSATELACSVAEALHHAHEESIVHRDIKPSNLLLDQRGKVWVTDFGLAHIEASPNLTKTGDIVGTLRYMSPEQALAKGPAIDHRSDIYSLGVTLYEFLTLRPAFGGRDRQELLRQITAEEPLAPRRINSQIPLDLQTIVLKAMSKEPASRYATAGAMADDLRRFLDHRPILARPPSRLDQLKKWTRRHQTAVVTATAAGGLLLAITVVLLAISTWLVSAAQRRTQLALDDAKENLAAAQRQSDRAEENFQMVTAAVDRLLTRVAQGPLQRPELESVRRDILEDALEFFERLRERSAADPALRYETAWAQMRVAVIHEVLGQKDKARDDWRRALALFEQLLAESPTSTSYRSSIARVAIPLGKLEADPARAESNYRRAIAVSGALAADEPRYFENRHSLAAAWQELGYHQWNHGRAQEAEESYRFALAAYEALAADMGRDFRFAPQQASADNSLGLLLRTSGRFAEAEQAHRRALHLLAPLGSTGPELARTNFHLGLSLWRLGRQEEAELAIRQAVVHREQVLVARPTDRFDRIELALTRNTLSQALECTGRLPDAEAARLLARDELVRLLEEFPEPEAHAAGLAGVQASLGRLLWNTDRKAEARGEFQAAIALYERVLAKSPDNPDSQVELAWLLANCPDSDSRDAPRAVQLAERAVQQSPDKSTGWTTLGAAHYRAGNGKAAAEALLRAAAMEPQGNPTAALLLAMTYSQQGELDLARRSLAQAATFLDKHPTLDPAILSFREEAKAVIAPLDPSKDLP
ncbi:MAG: protein kinase domain-containing protein [Pirellulaceae bacterium]